MIYPGKVWHNLQLSLSDLSSKCLPIPDRTGPGPGPGPGSGSGPGPGSGSGPSPGPGPGPGVQGPKIGTRTGNLLCMPAKRDTW
jgi:hypothetical protein